MTPREDETIDSICGVQVLQKRAGFRFTVDSVVVADFAARDPATGKRRPLGRVADLCSGSGVIGLLLARWGAEHVLGIDILEGMEELARRNAELNGFSSRVEAVCLDVRRAKELPAETFDVVVSNPPFHPASHRVSRDHGKAVATHELECTIADVAAAARWLAKPGGRFPLIFTAERTAELMAAARPLGWVPRLLRPVYPRPDLNAHALLWELVRGEKTGAQVLPPLFLKDLDGRDSRELSLILGAG